MSVSVNEPQRWLPFASGNVAYEWWCPKCGVYHYGLDCPKDDLTAKPEVNIKVFINNIKHEFCPCCGQLIKKEILVGIGTAGKAA